MKQLFPLILSMCMMFAACKSNDETETSDPVPETDELISMTKDGITLTELDNSPDFPEAVLSLNNDPTAEAMNGKVPFSFSVDNYELAVQTSDADGKCCANSDGGQHIHAIIDNGPYAAKYAADFELVMDEGSHIGLFFLSRSYHESIKNGTAFQLLEINPGENVVDLNQPMLFYSRPKGSYKPSDCEQVMLDFYLTNTEISSDGIKVRATINGTEFLIEKWCPYVMTGLPKGELQVKLELVDQNGDLVESVMNSVTRDVVLMEEEPVPIE